MSKQSVASRLAVGSGQKLRRFLGLLPTAYCLLFFAGSALAAETLPFIEDNYTRAVARAKEKNVPIFVEAWAPW